MFAADCYNEAGINLCLVLLNCDPYIKCSYVGSSLLKEHLINARGVKRILQAKTRDAHKTRNEGAKAPVAYFASKNAVWRTICASAH